MENKGYDNPPPYPSQQYPPGGAAAYPTYPQASMPYPSSSQQQSSVIVVSATQAQPVVFTTPYESYAAHMAFACVVFWVCNWLFGLIAFILAMSADSSKIDDPEGARRLGRASISVSIAGIIVTVIIIAVIIGIAANSSTAKH